MLKKAKKRVEKKGNPNGAHFTFQFVITVHSVEFTIADKKWIPNKLVVEWKRNARVASTKGVAVDLGKSHNSVLTVPFEEDISMIGTLSRDGDEFDAKEYKFSLDDFREKKTKKTLATKTINLAAFANLTNQTFKETFELDIISTKVSSAKLVMTISSHFVSQGNKEVDEMSMMSTVSFLPEDNKALNSSDSDNSDDKLHEKRDVSKLVATKKDEQVQILLDKIKKLETELSNATTPQSPISTNKELNDEIEMLKMKLQIEQERHLITKENLDNTKEELSKFEEESNTQRKKEHERYEEQIQALREELASKQDIKSPPIIVKNENQKENQNFEKEIKKLKQENKELLDIKKENESKHEKVLQELALVNGENLKLQSSLKQKETEIEQEKNLRESEKKHFQEEKKELIQSHEEKIKSLNSLKEKKEKEWQVTEEKLRKQIQQAQDSVASSDDQLTESLKAQIESLENEIEQINEDSETKITELQNVIHNLKAKIQNENENSSVSISLLQKENQELRTIVEKGKGDERVKQENESLKKELSELQKKYERLSGMYNTQEKLLEGGGGEKPHNSEDEALLKAFESLKNQKEEISEELHDITSQLINAKLALAEDQFVIEKINQSKKDLARQLAAEKLKSLELRKKITQMEVKVNSR